MLRDCKAWLDEGLPLSTSSNEAAKLYDDVINQYITWTENYEFGGIEGTLKRLLENDPSFVMAKVLSVGLDIMATTRSLRLDKEFYNDIVELEELSKNKLSNLTKREQLHCKAVCCFAQEKHQEACETWEEILKDFPKDVLALKFAHDAYFYLGNSIMIRDSLGRVLPQWNKTDKLFGYLNGMFAFGLEETNLFSLAKKHATLALELNPTDCWATHAMAHCFEMTGDTDNGIHFMKSTESNWNVAEMLACHNYWHWSLYHIEDGDYESALGIYDQQVGVRVKSGAALDIVDAASLLQRLEFQGLDVGERWNDIFEICRPRIDDHIMVFNDAHYLMTFIGAKKTDQISAFMLSVNEYVETTIGENRDLNKRIGVPLYNALISYNEGRFDDVVKLLYPIKNDLFAIGGSNAQRDVFQQLLLQSSILSPTTKNLPRALLNERKMIKNNSPLIDRMAGKLLSLHDE